MYRVGREEATRVELRSPDPACNPYLAFAVMIAAGYEGVRNGYKLEEPIEANIFSMDQKKRKRLRIDTLPGSLENAISEFKKSRLMKRVLGDHIFEKLIDNKIVEWDQYRIAVTGYEIDNYFPVL